MKIDSNVITGGFLKQNIIVDPQFIVNGSYVTFDQVASHFAGMFLSAFGSDSNDDEMVGSLTGGGGSGTPGAPGTPGAQGAQGPATHLLLDDSDIEQPIMMPQFTMPLVDIAYYAPGSFFLPDGSFAYMLNRLILTGSQEADIRGNARLCIEGAF